MKLVVIENVYDAMLHAARTAAPLEACGLCGGKDGRVTRFYELTNADASGDHFHMLPEEQFAAVKAMRCEDLELQAVWHSHPATPARMSAEDLRLAYTPDVVYLILSIADPAAPGLRGFTVEDGRDSPIEIVVSSDGHTGSTNLREQHEPKNL